MHLRISSFAKMAENIKENRSKVVMFGAGVIGTTVIPEILLQYEMDSYIDCYIDNDASKWGDSVRIGNRRIQICPPKKLKDLGHNVAVLINVSRYAELLLQLEELDYTSQMLCYIMPMMCMTNFCNKGGHGVVHESNERLIPKKIHYMWLGVKEIPGNLQRCIDSWKRYCPDYEIIRWDESNYNVDKCLYMKQAYETKNYGFVPDYARLDILYHYGGIYMDTDVEVVRSLDELLYQQAFCGVEKWQVVNFGGCSGAVKGHNILKVFLEEWEKRNFIRKDGTYDYLSSGYVDTRVAIDNGYILNGKNQNIKGMNLYTYDYFHPYDYMSGRMEMTDDTYTIHHFNGGWLDETTRLINRKTTENFERLYERARNEC